MKIKISLALAAAGLSLLSSVRATTITESFTSDPLKDGWQVSGDTNLFHWDAVNHVLDVTWDSTQNNSYFYHPLGTILGTNDDFSMSFDLVLTDCVIGVSPGYPSDFPIAAGLMNYAEASSTNFLRGSYPTQPDLAEFDYFQWDDVQPDTNTVWPTFVDSENDFYYNGTSSYAVVELPTNILMRVSMDYTAADQTCVLSITTNGGPVITPVVVVLNEPPGYGILDYHLDTFAVESYSQAESLPPGSVLAHGAIGNISIVVPPPPVTFLQGTLSHGVGGVQFASLTNWNYLLESSADLVTWCTNGAVVPGTGGTLILQDTNSPQPHQFYCVQALRQD